MKDRLIPLLLLAFLAAFTTALIAMTCTDVQRISRPRPPMEPASRNVFPLRIEYPGASIKEDRCIRLIVDPDGGVTESDCDAP